MDAPHGAMAGWGHQFPLVPAGAVDSAGGARPAPPCEHASMRERTSMQVLVVIPTYNERENLAALIPQVLAADASLHVLIVDDNSPDGTGALADEIARRTDRVRVLHRAGKLGLGTAYLQGFAYALRRQYTHVVEMDADFSHRPEDLPRLLDAALSADVVIGSRNVPGGRTENWSFLRTMISKGGSLYARTVLDIPVKDCTGGFKCFSRYALETVDLRGIRSGGFGFQVEMNYRCHRAGLRLLEVPIVFPDRVRGTSKMSWRIFSEALLLVWQLRLQRPPTGTSRIAPTRAGYPAPMPVLAGAQQGVAHGGERFGAHMVHTPIDGDPLPMSDRHTEALHTFRGVPE